MMSWETFEQALGFLKRSGVQEARFLGGEPTLHPRLYDMLQEAIGRGFRTLLFSNGLFPGTVLEQLQGLPTDRFSVLINWISPEDNTEDSVLLQCRTLAALGHRARLGLNIWQAGASFDFLLDYVERYGLKRRVRLGLAHPSLHSRNRFLHPKSYAAAGARIESFTEEASRHAVTLELDCGFVPCMFSDSFRSRFPEVVRQAGRRCNPIPDILPGSEIIACYPLAAGERIQLDQTEDADAARSFFRERLGDFQGIGIYPHCGSCSGFRERSCLGGCRSAAVLRLRSADAHAKGVERRAVAITLGARSSAGHVANPSIPLLQGATSSSRMPRRIWVLPYIDQPLEFWQRLRDDFGNRILEVYFPLPGGLIGSGRPAQPDVRLEEFLRDARLPAGVLVNHLVLPESVQSVAGPIIDVLRRLRDEHGVRAATVANLLLAARIREALPDITLTASVLMDICQPNQALLLDGVFDRLVPSGRILRDLPALRALRAAFHGPIRLILNEGCLSGCPLRTQHFYEMAALGHEAPESLCGPILAQHPWLRLTGAWVLPQHLGLFEGIYDELKLAGRVTLRDPARYFKVVTSYMLGLPLRPDEIGGGPASPGPMEIEGEFFEKTLECGHACHVCHLCEDYWRRLHTPGRSFRPAIRVETPS